MPPALRRRAAGFTMIELMVVVAILGVTAAFVLRGFKANPVGADARRIATSMATAYRTALAGGPVRADVASASGGTRARAMLEIDASGPAYQVTVWRLTEDDPPATGFTWNAVDVASLSTDTEVFRVADGATIGLSTTEITAGGLPVSKFYYPSGMADPFTVYLRHRHDTSADRYRVVGLPLSPAPQVFKDW